MSIYTTLEKITSIAIGGFDGIHLAHQKLFDHLGEAGAVVAIETGHATMTPGMERQKYTRYPVVIYALDTIRHLDDAGFIALLMGRFPNLSRIVVGYDFRFGTERRFDASHLKALNDRGQAHFQGEVIVVPEVILGGVSVHSHTIRHALREGNIKQANALLGRFYSIEGSVVAGQGLGKRSFVPTLNILPHQLLPMEGVYITQTRVDDARTFDSITFLGKRATTEGGFAVETHLLDVEAIETTRCTVFFLEFLRPNEKFDTFEALSKQINIDIQHARDFHAF